MLKRPFRHEFQPVWFIAHDPDISIVCKGAATLTYFAKEATSVASRREIVVARRKKSTVQGPPDALDAGRNFILSASTGDLRDLGNVERNVPKAKARESRMSGKRISHWKQVRCRTGFSVDLISLCKAHSQIRITRQPAFRKICVTNKSRVLFVESLRCQNEALFFGLVACRGRPCQKQPPMKTANRAFRNAKSRVTLPVGETS